MNAAKPLLLSLKPCYAKLVFSGRKMAEFRRRITPNVTNRDVFIYVSSPIMALSGGFRVGEVWSGSPREVWGLASELGSVNKPDFDTYFYGNTVAYALEIKEVWKYPKPVNLDTLRGKFTNFNVPQSWRYVRDHEYEFFQKMRPKKNLSLTCVEMQASH